MPQPQVVILAAGMGTRLGRPLPKPLTRLASGETLIQRQLDGIRSVFGTDVQVTVVVGFRFDLVMEHIPDAVFVYNQEYAQTNTAKSLLKALRASHPGSLIWMNGDVVFDPEVLRRLSPFLATGRSAVAVNTASVSDEEVKYRVDDRGFINAISKEVADGLGEAVGINLVGANDRAALEEQLAACSIQDYFERAIEMVINLEGAQYTPVDISDLFAVEVDFEDDLARANSSLTRDDHH